jgi:hypothetical protein
MFRLYRNCWLPSCSRIQGGALLMLAHSQIGMVKTMERKNDHIGSKGGRPKKAVKKDQLLGLKCSLFERKVIQAKAKLAKLTVSEYIRAMSLTGKIDSQEKALPKEVLQLTGTLNHLAANMNQVAKKRNSNEELNAIERASLQVLAADIKRLAQNIKTYLQ